MDPAYVVLGVVLFVLAAVIGVNTALYFYAKKLQGPRKPPKKVGAKKAKREKLKMGIQPAGE